MQRRDFFISAVGMVGAARLGSAEELKHDKVSAITTMTMGFVDVSVDVTELLRRCPDEIRQESKSLSDWINKVFHEIIKELESLRPGECFVHDSLVVIKKID